MQLKLVYLKLDSNMGFPGGSDGKIICPPYGTPGFNPWVGKISWKREWQLTLVFLPEESYGQRSLGGYSPWGRKESDMTERLIDTHTLPSVFLCVHPVVFKIQPPVLRPENCWWLQSNLNKDVCRALFYNILFIHFLCIGSIHFLESKTMWLMKSSNMLILFLLIPSSLSTGKYRFINS